MNKKGFTFIEMIIVLMFIPIIMTLTLSLLNLMKQEIPEIIEQDDIFLLQIHQLLMRSSNLFFEEDHILFSFDMIDFKIMHHNNRLVKRPGYEILLTDVISVENTSRCFYIKTKKRDLCIEK